MAGAVAPIFFEYGLATTNFGHCSFYRSGVSLHKGARIFIFI